MQNYDSLKNQAIKICLETSDFIKNQLGKVNTEDIQEKEMNSLVSYVDKSAEEKLVKGLAKCLPEATFVTEEDTVENLIGEYVWIIDPLDGTNNFLHQIPHFSISIALQYQNEIVLGIVHDIMRNDCFHASKDKGSYMNTEKISVSQIETLSQALIATGFPYNNDYKEDPYINSLVYWLKHTRGVRRFGSAALDLAYVACGRFDCYYEANLNAWDIAAGSLLVSEAGGTVSDFTGGQSFGNGKQIVATNSLLHQNVLNVLDHNFNGTFDPK